MSNGYLLAAEADLAAAHEVADGFGLDVIDASSIHDPEATARALQGAANVGILLSAAGAADEKFMALLASVAAQVARAQLILAEADVRAAFAFLPETWPAMSLDEARTRAQALARNRDGASAEGEQAHAAPLPSPPAPEEGRASEPPDVGAPAPPASTAPAPQASQGNPPLLKEDSMLAEAEPSPPARKAAPPSAPATLDSRYGKMGEAMGGGAAGASTPADATAFAPRKLQRGTPELVRIVVHQPKDLAAVIKAARMIDPRTAPAPQGMSIGEVALGASVGVSLEVRGAACDGALQRRTWAGEPIDFSFTVEADAAIKQAVLLARVFVNDAQIGVLAFTRPISGPSKNPASSEDRVRLKRHKRVFLSYSSKDRETVSAIATAYQMAGVAHFWDRASLKSGEEWHPRLRREIDRADLFHLCWSKSASASQWVERETEYALTRRRRSNGRNPDITVQMLDGPPWAPHPPSLDSINFDDFVRAAIVGYARGEG